MILGTILSKQPPVIQVARLMGAAIVAASIIMINHEWVQAGHESDPHYQFHPTRDMLAFFVVSLFSVALLMFGIAQNAQWTLIVTPLVVGWLVIFEIRLVVAEERRRAHFDLLRSLSFQVFCLGILLTLLGLVLV